jgi:hypothetical protein
MTQHFRLRTFVACLLTASTYAVVPSAFAEWFAYGDYRGCTGRGYESTPRKEGPFTKSECDLRVSDVDESHQCNGAHFYCKEEDASSEGSSSSNDYGAARHAQKAEAVEAEQQRQQAEAERIKRERRAEEKHQKDAAFIRDRDAAAKSLKGSSDSAMSQLKGLSSSDNSGLKGSGFDSGSAGLKGLQGSDHANQAAHSQPALHTDTSVVDARNIPSGLDKATENAIAKAYPNALPGVSDRVRKGFQAVKERDWKVAKAWFEDALNRDPNNPGLQRLVVLADYSQQHVQRRINGKPFTDEDIPADADPQTYAITSTKIHSHAAWMKFLFPDGKNLRKSAPVFKTLSDGRVMQLPSESDILFLFPGEPASPAPTPTPTFIIGKDGQLIQVPENSDQKSTTYIKGKDGKLLAVPQPSDSLLLFPGNSPTATPKPAVKSGKTK